MEDLVERIIYIDERIEDDDGNREFVMVSFKFETAEVL